MKVTVQNNHAVVKSEQIERTERVNDAATVGLLEPSVEFGNGM